MLVFQALIIDYSKTCLRVLLKLRKVYNNTNKIDYILSLIQIKSQKNIFYGLIKDNQFLSHLFVVAIMM